MEEFLPDFISGVFAFFGGGFGVWGAVNWPYIHSAVTENVVIADSSKEILKPIYLEINGFFKCAFYDKINIFIDWYNVFVYEYIYF